MMMMMLDHRRDDPVDMRGGRGSSMLNTCAAVRKPQLHAACTVHIPWDRDI